MAATLTCQHCGGELAAGNRYCAICGAEAGPTPFDESATNPVGALADIAERLRRVTLGEFEIGPELGHGGMAAVFLAHEIALDRKVAIKVMSPGLLLDDGMVERFKREAITVGHLNHPGIVSAYSVRHAEGLYFFIMRYVEGRSLEQVLQRTGPLPVPTARSILHQVGSALAYAHRSGVIHRDIKPANILIDRDGNAVVTDFGIAKVAERPNQTLTGALVGTPAYMSPEQCKGGSVSGASDQYSLGAVAYEMVTGVPPFSGSTLTVMQSHVEREPHAIHELVADCPPEIEAAIHRMLEKEPEARWPRLADALTALGAEVLAEDHPLRTELSRLVTADAESPDVSTTPTSPVPRARGAAMPSGPLRAISAITVMPAPAGLEVGDSFTLAAIARGPNGTRLPPQPVEWTSDAPAVVRVNAENGVATAVGAGPAKISATLGGVTGQLRLEVTTPRADDIVIEPMAGPLQAGEEIRLDATARDKRGRPVYRPVSWISADPGVAVVTPQGTIAGREPGTVRITAALDDARASIVIPVLPARVAAIDIADPPTSVHVGQTVVLRATPVDGNNTPLPGRLIVWGTSDPGVAMVTGDGGIAARQPGSVVLTATCEGVRAMVRIAVVAPARTEPAHHGGSRRHGRRLRRRTAFAAGAALALAGAWVWRRNASGAAGPAVPPLAPYVAGAPAADSLVPASVVITRGVRSLRPDSVAMLGAEVRDAAGHPRTGAAIAWSTSDSSVVAVDRATGRVRGRRPGRAFVVASGDGGRDSLEIAVRRPAGRTPSVAAVRIVPFPAIRVGDTLALHAVPLGAHGDTLLGADIDWASNRPGVASVDPASGVVRGTAPGTTVIVARSGLVTAFAELSVLPATVAAIQILGARPMAVGEMLDLRAVGDGRSDGPMPTSVAWSSSDSSVAAVDQASGTVLGRAPGSARITATADGATAWIRLTVLPRPERLPTASAVGRTDPRFLAGVAECYSALQTHDIDRLRAVWHPARTGDERFDRLSRILQQPDATVGERIDGGSTVGLEAASLEFAVPLSWRDGAAARSSQPVFRVEFVRNAGRWEMSSCRVTGPAEL
ncbi:MAG: protein kinase domain-containing protein [Gemmatimonadales bacterium]